MMRTQDPEREPRPDPAPEPKAKYFADDSPHMSTKDKVRHVLKRELLWGDSWFIWPSRIAGAVENQPGSKPSEIWVERVKTPEDARAARAEREAPWDQCSEAVRLVRVELRRLLIARSGVCVGR